jgi:hypothetical protein
MIKEQYRDRLDRVLGSGIFENGAKRANFEVADYECEISNISEQEIAGLYKAHILNTLGLKENSAIEQLDKYIDLLQHEIRRKTPFARLGGEIGKTVHLCMFLVVLKQRGSLLYFMQDFLLDSTVQDYVKPWLDCVKIRTISRNL